MTASTLAVNVRYGYGVGWSFTPLSGKRPVLPGWQERPREALEEALAWAAKGNVGLRTGKASGVVVIDADPGADVGPLKLPATVTAKTGRAGAFHFYFRTDALVGNSSGRLGPHVDVKGDGGQVVFPGSVHPETGVLYEWVVGSEPWNVKLSELPPHIMGMLREPPRPDGSGPDASAPEPPTQPPFREGSRETPNPYAAKALRDELAAVASAPEGVRNDTLNKSAFSLGTLIGGGYLDRSEVEAALREAAHSAGLSGHEVEATIRSGIESGMKQPRVIAQKDCPKARAGAAQEYILIPGAHSDDGGNHIEQSSTTFADTVLSRLPEGAIYRRDFIIGEILGEPGGRKWVEFAHDRMRLVVDGHVRLGQWGASRKAKQQVLIYRACSNDAAGLVIAQAANAPRVRELRLMVSYPIYGQGFARVAPGWDDGIYYDEPGDLRGLEPEREQGVIRDVMDDLLVDFPFQAEADQQNFIGLMLTPIVAPALDGNRPLHLLHAPLERTGKTKLVEEILGVVVLGRPTPAMQVAEHDDERDKRITAYLLQGGTVLHLDNLPPYIDSAAFSSLLTATTYSGRVLGLSRIVNLPNTLTIVASGNNVQASGEIAKRIVPIMLQPKDAHPERRTDFVHPDLRGYVRGRRRVVIECLLGMVENWFAAGKPMHPNTLGGFESWSGVVGGILMANDFTEWRKNESAWQTQADPKGSEMEVFVTLWDKTFGDTEVSPKQLRVIAQENELFGPVFAKIGDAAINVAFGRMLSRYTDTPVNQWFIRRSGASNHARYRLEAIQ